LVGTAGQFARIARANPASPAAFKIVAGRKILANRGQLRKSGYEAHLVDIERGEQKARKRPVLTA